MSSFIKQILIVIILILPTIIFSSTSEEIHDTYFQQGNKAYDDGNYEFAIESYNKIVDDGYESGEVYYNLGNSYYKSNDIINAIVSYERGLKYIPNNENLRDNLDIANLSIVDRTKENEELPLMNYIENIERDYNIFTIRSTFIMIFFVLAILISITIIISNNRVKKILNILSSFTLLSLLIILYLYVDISNKNSIKYGLVSIDKISIMSSPDDNTNNTTLFSLHKGTKVRIKSETDKWFNISISSEKKGWLKKESVIEI